MIKTSSFWNWKVYKIERIWDTPCHYRLALQTCRREYLSENFLLPFLPYQFVIEICRDNGSAHSLKTSVKTPDTELRTIQQHLCYTMELFIAPCLHQVWSFN